MSNYLAKTLLNQWLVVIKWTVKMEILHNLNKIDIVQSKKI